MRHSLQGFVIGVRAKTRITVTVRKVFIAWSASRLQPEWNVGGSVTLEQSMMYVREIAGISADCR
jgi:uncharacterized protein YndB with AHSA1/START domain